MRGGPAARAPHCARVKKKKAWNNLWCGAPTPRSSEPKNERAAPPRRGDATAEGEDGYRPRPRPTARAVASPRERAERIAYGVVLRVHGQPKTVVARARRGREQRQRREVKSSRFQVADFLTVQHYSDIAPRVARDARAAPRAHASECPACCGLTRACVRAVARARRRCRRGRRRALRRFGLLSSRGRRCTPSDGVGCARRPKRCSVSVREGARPSRRSSRHRARRAARTRASWCVPIAPGARARARSGARAGALTRVSRASHARLTTALPHLLLPHPPASCARRP